MFVVYIHEGDDFGVVAGISEGGLYGRDVQKKADFRKHFLASFSKFWS